MNLYKRVGVLLSLLFVLELCKRLHVEKRLFFQLFQNFSEQNELNNRLHAFLGMCAKKKCAKIQRQILHFVQL